MQVKIRCGVQGKHSTKYPNIFWPVCKAISTSFKFDMQTFKHPYSLIFSSKTAIDFFYEEVFQAHQDVLNNCKAVYFVGEQSELYFQKTFLNCSEDLVLCTSAKMGMKNLIETFSLTESDENLIFVTALFGKSKSIIEKTRFNKPHVLIPIYKLVSRRSNFLQKLFEDFKLEDQKFVFECHSGQIFEYAAHALIEHFDCDDILSLPKNIEFSSFGQSTFDKSEELYAKS